MNVLVILIALLLVQAPPAPQVGQQKKGQQQGQYLRIPRAIAHQATLNYANSSCTTAKLCNLQVYRALCPSASSCPAYSQGASGWTELPSSAATATPGASSTTWVVIDNDATMQDATTYVWVATNSFQSSSTTYSPASPPWSGTTSSAPPAPPAPVNGSGNTIQ